jgi:hypothetical protein
MREANGDVCLNPVTFPGFGPILIEGKLADSRLLSRAEVTPSHPGCFVLLDRRT